MGFIVGQNYEGEGCGMTQELDFCNFVAFLIVL